MNKLIIAGIAVLVAIYIFFSALYVVNEREQAIVLRFGQITEVRTEPGVYFKIPTDIVDTVQIIDDRLLPGQPACRKAGAIDGEKQVCHGASLRTRNANW